MHSRTAPSSGGFFTLSLRTPPTLSSFVIRLFWDVGDLAFPSHGHHDLSS